MNPLPEPTAPPDHAYKGDQDRKVELFNASYPIGTQVGVRLFRAGEWQWFPGTTESAASIIGRHVLANVSVNATTHLVSTKQIRPRAQA